MIVFALVLGMLVGAAAVTLWRQYDEDVFRRHEPPEQWTLWEQRGEGRGR